MIGINLLVRATIGLGAILVALGSLSHLAYSLCPFVSSNPVQSPCTTRRGTRYPSSIGLGRPARDMGHCFV